MSSSLFQRFPNQFDLFSDVNLGPTQIEWETRDFDLFLRPTDAPVELVWAYLTQAILHRGFESVKRHRTTRNKIVGVYNTRRLWRYHQLENGQELCLRASFGLLRRPNSRQFVRFEIPKKSFGSGADYLHATPQRLEALVRDWLEDSASDFHAAHLWAEQNPDSWEFLKWEKGAREELEPLLRGLFHIFDFRGLDAKHWIHRFTVHKDMAAPWQFPLPENSEPPDEWQISDRLYQLLNQHFEIVQEEKLWRGYDQSGAPARLPLPEVVCSAPTMHEKLEALLLWRDWLRDKVSPEELEILLPKL